LLIRTGNGSYMPSYFFINIESDEKLDELLKNNEQTFVHEYIHFLQDLILPYCIRANMTIRGQLACISTYSKQYKELIKPFDRWDEDCIITSHQLDYIWGCSDFYESVETIFRIRKEFYAMPTGQNVYKYLLETDIGSYQVGARDLLEYIAHKIETKYWSVNTYDFPYRTVDKLFDHFGFSDIPTEVRLCFVEYCLYNDNPIHCFFELMTNQQIIDNNRNIFLSYDSCKETLMHLGWYSRGDFNESIFSKTKRRLNDFRNWLGNQYSHKQFADINKWVDYVSSYVETKLSNRFFFSELYYKDLDEFEDTFNKIVEDLGIPLIFNNEHECAFMLPAGFEPEHFDQFYVMQKFMRYITSTDDRCPIGDFCKRNTALSQKECIEDPFYAVSRDVLCPFTLFVKSYGLHLVDIKKGPI
jgi:hypothetical protein